MNLNPTCGCHKQQDLLREASVGKEDQEKWGVGGLGEVWPRIAGCYGVISGGRRSWCPWATTQSEWCSFSLDTVRDCTHHKGAVTAPVKLWKCSDGPSVDTSFQMNTSGLHARQETNTLSSARISPALWLKGSYLKTWNLLAHTEPTLAEKKLTSQEHPVSDQS